MLDGFIYYDGIFRQKVAGISSMHEKTFR